MVSSKSMALSIVSMSDNISSSSVCSVCLPASSFIILTYSFAYSWTAQECARNLVTATEKPLLSRRSSSPSWNAVIDPWCIQNVHNDISDAHLRSPTSSVSANSSCFCMEYRNVPFVTKYMPSAIWPGWKSVSPVVRMMSDKGPLQRLCMIMWLRSWRNENNGCAERKGRCSSTLRSMMREWGSFEIKSTFAMDTLACFGRITTSTYLITRLTSSGVMPCSRRYLRSIQKSVL
mmetsp:Transcript_111133/g.313564  ORF Transcript_111133/g.313564 Transcript_111133/m.313564 type:complete len:233 (-) Transcript_111133:1782-2480(-)